MTHNPNLIPEQNMKFAFLRKMFFPSVLIWSELAKYLETIELARPAYIISRSVEPSLLAKNILKTDASKSNIFYTHGEPDKEQLENIEKAIQAGAYDTIVAIGGGSVIDTAKIIKKNTSLPLIVIPTTPATGSEVTPYALYTSEHTKVLVRSQATLPDVVVLDSTLLKTIEPKQMGYFLFDILGHALEGFISKMATPFSDAYARETISLVLNSYKDLKQSPDVSLEKIQTAGTLGGFVQNMASVGLAHSFAHYFGPLSGTSHAEAISLFLKPILEINARNEGVKEKLISFEYASPEDLFSKLEDIKSHFGLDITSITLKEFDPKQAIVAIKKDFCVPTNPVRFEEKDFLSVFEQTIHHESH